MSPPSFDQISDELGRVWSIADSSALSRTLGGARDLKVEGGEAFTISRLFVATESLRQLSGLLKKVGQRLVRELRGEHPVPQFLQVKSVQDLLELAQHRVYKTLDGGATWTIQFENQLPAGFYDGFAFWTPHRGILHGDSINGVFHDL